MEASENLLLIEIVLHIQHLFQASIYLSGINQLIQELKNGHEFELCKKKCLIMSRFLGMNPVLLILNKKFTFSKMILLNVFHETF